MYVHIAAPAPAASILDANVFTSWLPAQYRIAGAHRRPRGRLIITTYVPGDVQARADSLSAGGTYTVKPAALATGQQFVGVSGMASCVGVIVLRKQGGRFVQGSAAHFNQLWSNANLWQTAWQQIGNSLGAGPGEIYAFILANASWSENWIQNSLLPNIEPELTTLGVGTERYCYRSTQSTNAFVVRSDGILGEPFNPADFSH